MCPYIKRESCDRQPPKGVGRSQDKTEGSRGKHRYWTGVACPITMCPSILYSRYNAIRTTKT